MPRRVVLLAVVLCASACAHAQLTIIDQHPRLVFSTTSGLGDRTFQDVRSLYSGNAGYRSGVNSWFTGGYTEPVHQASRFVMTGTLSYAQSALDQMYAGTLTYGGSETAPEAGLEWALAYDWIYNAWQGQPPPLNLATKLAAIEGKIATWVDAALNDLDTNGPSLWHGRAATGALAWSASLALSVNTANNQLRNRAWSRWQDSLLALHAAQAWPEGPTYWANNRAISFPLAYMNYQTAVVTSSALSVSDALGDLRATGLWQAYSQRGDGTVDRYGDAGSQVMISNGTLGRSIDVYAMATQDPALAAFAQQARQYRTPFYDSSYGWMYAVGYDPNQAKPAGYNSANPGACLAGALPNAMVFGATGEGLAIIRQGWNTGDTQISFKAGDYLAHHGHYDQGTFTMFKYAPLVINSGNYGDYYGDERLNYYVRTVSVNSIIVQRPDETWSNPGVTPPSGYANDGGQRLVQPTGSTVTSYANWLANKTSGKNYESGDIIAFQQSDGQYAYIGSDITRAYNSTLYDSQGQGGKVSLVTRQVVYLEDLDAMIVFDRVNSTNSAYKKKWTLHTPNKFLGGVETVVSGTAVNGIVTVEGTSIAGNTMTMTNGGGKLFLQTLLPVSYTVNKVGGPGYRYYVESDGNDADGYDGVNYSGGANEQSWFDNGDWRIEISPKNAANFDTFLNVLSPRASTAGSVTAGGVLAGSTSATVMAMGNHVVGFGTTGRIAAAFNYTLTSGGNFDTLLVDLPASRFHVVAGGPAALGIWSSSEGVLSFTDSAGAGHTITVTGRSDPFGGDANLDGIVDVRDLAILACSYNQWGTWLQGDFNRDFLVDVHDLAALAYNYNQMAPPSADVPEPACLAVLLAGAWALLRRRRS